MKAVPLIRCFLAMALLQWVQVGEAFGRAALDERLQNVLLTVSASQDVPVIIHLNERADLSGVIKADRKERRALMIGQLRTTAERSQQGLRQDLKRCGVSRQRSLWAVNAVAAAVPAGIIPELAARPEVAGINLDASVSLPQPVSAVTPVASSLSLVGAPILWERGIAGQNIVVATVDSGVDINHADLGPRWRGGGNSWYDPNGEHPAAPFDHSGHGTGVLSVLVGGSATGTAIGVAPEAKWIAVKIFNDAGAAPYSSIYAGYQWLLDPDDNPATDDAPDIVNNSWSLDSTINVCYSLSQEFLELIQLFKIADIAMVFAAGNTGPGLYTSVSPANYAESFSVGSVGAVLSETEVSDFSARGPSACDGTIYPELVAPGYAVRTADLTAGGVFPAASTIQSGTSFAAPSAAGVMALLRSVFPAVSASMLGNVLLRSARDVDVTGPDNAGGYGLVDSVAAFSILNANPRTVGAYENGVWYLDANGNGQWNGTEGGDHLVIFGTAEMLPVTGDWDGNGTYDVGAFENGIWYLDANGNGKWDGTGSDLQYTFGTSSMIPVVGDWNGDGISEVGAYENGIWYLDANGNGSWDGVAGGDRMAIFGTGAMLPVPGDWNGDGISEIGAYEAGVWYLDSNGNGAWDGTEAGDRRFYFGTTAMTPVAGDWDGDGSLDVGAFESGTWYLDTNGNGSWDDVTEGDRHVVFGTAQMRAVTFR